MHVFRLNFRHFSGLVVLLLLAAVLAACGQTPTSQPVSSGATNTTASVSNRVAIGQPAPDFATQTFDGQPLQISALKGKALIINYWAVY